MAKVAHITSKPGIEVGEKALGLCGTEFKVKVLWADVPTEKPICRECVDVAADAMTEADALISHARVRAMLVENRLESLTQTLNPPDLFLDVIADNQSEYDAIRAEKAERKAAKKRAKTTCTCTWESPELFVEDPDCPIHATEKAPSEEEDVPVAPEE